jgi:hypothetical protein
MTSICMLLDRVLSTETRGPNLRLGACPVGIFLIGTVRHVSSKVDPDGNGKSIDDFVSVKPDSIATPGILRPFC